MRIARILIGPERLCPLGVVIVVALAACGGGGGGGGSAASPGPTTLVVNHTSVSATSSVLQPVVPSTTISLTMENVNSAQYVGLGYTDTGIADAALQLTSASAGIITINYRAPTSLKPHAYADTVHLEICTDSACKDPVPGSAVSISIAYTITPIPSNAVPTITFSQTALSAQALAIDPFYPPSVSENVSMTNFVIPPYFTATSQNPGVSSPSITANSLSQGTLSVSFKPGNTVGAGIYTGPILITACLDSTCANPVPGSPFLIDVSYTVGNSVNVGGPDGYTVQGIQVQIQGMVWDRVNQSLWVVLPFDITGKSHVAAVNPVTQTMATPVALDSTANGAIAISDDSQFLYVGLSNGEVQRLSLPDLSTNLRITTGQQSVNAGVAVNVQVAPGAPHTIAVALSQFGTGGVDGYETGVAVFDDDVMRPKEALATVQLPQFPSGTAVDFVQWGDTAETLYGSDFAYYTNPSIYTMTLDINGIETTANLGQVSGGQMHLAQGLLYLDGGSIFNPGTNTVKNTFSGIPNIYGLLPDTASGRLFLSRSDQLQGSVVLQSFDLQALTPLAQISLPP